MTPCFERDSVDEADKYKEYINTNEFNLEMIDKWQ